LAAKPIIGTFSSQTLIRTADIKQAGSTTAARSADGDRPPGRPRRGEARSAE
jgi:hypothetical protein